MPELPEVETVLQGLKPSMVGQTLEFVELRRKNLRYPFPVNMDSFATDVMISGMERRSKYILIRLSSGMTLISHLGMSGKFTVHKKGVNVLLEKHDHIVFHMASGVTIVYNDPRRFGFLLAVKTCQEATETHLAKLGVEPMADILTSDYIYSAFKNRKVTIKNALLDQSIIAGLGNIYVCEALWRANVSPMIKAKNMPREKIADLTHHILCVIDEAITAGGSSLKDYRTADGAMGYFQHAFGVYGRSGEMCSVCGDTIKRITQNARSTFYCPTCQNTVY